MWEKIKKFFKWIADHTGISWIARKISSGWKWLFGGKANTTQQNASQQDGRSGNERQEIHSQSKDNTLPKAPSDEPILGTPNQTPPPGKPKEPVINTSETDAEELPENFLTPNPKNADSDVLKEASNENYLKVGGKGLLLVLTSEQLAKCKENSEATRLNALLIYIKCDANEYRITGNSVDEKIISIESIQKKNENGQFKKISAKEILGNAMVKKVDSISNRAFGAPTLEQPKPNDTSHNVTQQAVSNEEVATEELADTLDQPKSPVVPDKSQEPVVNPPKTEEKGKPNNAASNGEVQPEVSNEKVTIESEEFFDAEDDGVTQPRSLTTDMVVEQPASGSEVASPSETKNGSNNGAVVLYQMLHNQGRLHPSPELYDYLLRASLVKEMLFCKVVPNSSFTQPIAKQATGNDHSR